MNAIVVKEHSASYIMGLSIDDWPLIISLRGDRSRNPPEATTYCAFVRNKITSEIDPPTATLQDGIYSAAILIPFTGAIHKAIAGGERSIDEIVVVSAAS
ncbi:hypothetical protein PLEOSDRAFT_159717 [Pleurotus ostreatus PC15]|uniref:Uncharacterized protein n=1 Tax=Pleurotus ostreatus (strain PC15) TaxID=1137138 RepID=A0A067NQK2_PLEO1|nr:hypothetical protein PLEOSDRAFT_159717 [Pleurotus ostreatus PC15]